MDNRDIKALASGKIGARRRRRIWRRMGLKTGQAVAKLAEAQARLSEGR